jgi:hypothetical protein
MSSETSTDAQTLPARGGHTGDAGLHPWQLFTLAALICAAIVAYVAGHQPPAVRVALILTVFAAAAIGVAALRALAPLTRGYVSTAAPIVGGRTRIALEREKALALRSIKELEFDRAMGKVSEKDFADMSARLRARAARILRQLDEGSGYREDIEREIARRLAAPRPEQTRDDALSAAGADAAPPPPAEAAGGPRECGSCAAPNDADARFCKACGARLEAA